MLGRVLRIALVAALAALVYLNTLGNEFVYDDGAQILRNHYIRNTSYLREIFTTNVWSFLGPHALSNYYRPMMHLIYMADYAMSGYSPAGYHATNILLHALNSVLVLLLGEALLLPAGAAFGGALLFAVHPIATEPVAWVAGVPELSYALFFLLSLWLYVAVRPPANGRKAWPVGWLAASVLAALLALFSKETALMLLPAIALYEHLFRQSGQAHWKRSLFYAGHVAATAFYLAMRVHSLGGFQVATNPYGVMPPWQFVLSAIYLTGKYVAKLVVPAPFNIFHVFHPARGLSDWRVLGGLLVLAGLAAGAWPLWRGAPNRRRAAFAFVMLLLPLVPALDVRAIGHNIFTERYLYLPLAGFAWLLAAALGYLATRHRSLAIGLLVLLVSNYGLLTYYRNRDWHDDVLLYTVTLQVSPESNLIRDNLGKSFLDGFGRPGLALALFSECARRAPDRAEYRYGQALAYAELRRYDEAFDALGQTLALWPNYPEAFLARGDIYREQGDLASAERDYRRALEIKPTYAEALTALGSLQRAQGHLSPAEASFRRALQVTDLADAHLNLGLLWLDQARYAEAEGAFRQVLVSELHSVAAWYGLGKALAGQARLREALECYRTALNERKFARPRRLGRVPLPDQLAIKNEMEAVEKGLSLRAASHAAAPLPGY